MSDMIQLFDDTSFTFTYLLIDQVSREAVLIDPVDTQVERDLAAVNGAGSTLKLILETHAHADHITSAGRLREITDAKTAAPIGCGIAPADIQLFDGDEIHFGCETITVIHTPGHTAGSVSYLWRGRIFTGDALLINGCGRTDFQSGDPGMLYDSITEKLFKLPDDTAVYPAHDYHGEKSSTIGQERLKNPRIAGKTRDEFIQIMKNLNLPPPRLIDVAVPANRRLGLPHGG